MGSIEINFLGHGLALQTTRSAKLGFRNWKQYIWIWTYRSKRSPRIQHKSRTLQSGTI